MNPRKSPPRFIGGGLVRIDPVHYPSQQPAMIFRSPGGGSIGQFAGTQTLKAPIVGFREWSVLEDGRLQSPFVRECMWETEMTAECFPTSRTIHRPHRTRLENMGLMSHKAPGRHCSCGFYVYEELGKNPGANFMGRGYVPGVVVAWGRVCVHVGGCRAEHVRILALGAQPPQVGTHEQAEAKYQRIRWAADRLGVPVIPTHGLVSFAAEHGAYVPPENRPE